MGKKLTGSSAKSKSGGVVVPANTAQKPSNAPPKLTRSDSGVDVTKDAEAKPLPVTLLSGFLGSGKTTLLQHILKSDHGLRIAVIVNDIGAVNVDASLIKKSHRLTKTEEKVIALQNGCICCTLRGDLLEELVNLSELHEFDYVIIESSGISEPEQVAETFDARLAEQMAALGEGPEGLDENTMKLLKRLADAGGVDKFARLDTTVTVIDAFTIFNDFHTSDLLSSRRDDVVPEDERTVSDLMVDQIEFADVIVLNKIDMVSKADRARVLDLIKKLNPRAKVLEASYSKIDVKEIVNTNTFDLKVAQSGVGWLQDLHAMTVREVNGRKAITPKPETEEYNVRNFVYTRTRPFHPRRLWSLLYDKFILQMEAPEDDEDAMDEDEDDADMSDADGSDEEADDDDDDDEEEEEENDDEDDDMEDPLEPPENDVILANKTAHPLFNRLFRSKGEFFLATRPHRAGDWSQAGAMLTMTGGRPWFCTLPPEDYLTGDAEVDALVAHDVDKGGEWGDRRQELVFIGENLDVGGLEAALDACLLDDAEWKRWGKVMRNERWDDEKKRDRLQDLFDDGFPDWAEEDHGDHEGHDHA
ncbi:CobW/HypB/UreG [Colletotrichum higginsianum IMI 349063]|uniref:CobW/HypB/UreG n=3 Tax=Colletotrichum higginsianum TaxID=80884 RepID=A0A1B7YWC0_COLHI|nr:CobW/HypB/UreG [Colletotrichum higginsianum IMI 349063]OBR16341.1 CobW/HypB/UreG [Colletotrichum higginsianum IMI 349063]TID03909.1 putative metal chaperone YciC [Colletotrichum higginsianum]